MFVSGQKELSTQISQFGLFSCFQKHLVTVRIYTSHSAAVILNIVTDNIAHKGAWTGCCQNTCCCTEADLRFSYVSVGYFGFVF